MYDMQMKFLPMAALLALSACASPQSRLESGLRSAGLSPKLSACMADRMIDKLSLLQLKRMSSLSNFKDEGLRDMTLDRFLYNIRALEDPEIMSVTTKAGLSCAVLR
jgi:hypothetical protein